MDGGRQASAGEGGTASAPDEPFDAARRLALFDALPDAVVVIDREARVLWINRTLTDVAGFTLDEVVGTTILDYVHPDDVAYMLWSFEARTNDEGNSGLIVQARVRHADGRWLMGEVLGRALFDEPTVGAMVVTFRDLSRQSALADSPARLRSMVDRTTDVVLLLDGDGHIVYANRRLTSLVDHDCDRVVGSSWLVLLDEADRARATAELARLVAAGDQATARWRATMVTPRGAPRPVELHAVHQLDDPVIAGIIVAARDVAELVAMEAELLAQRDALAHEASHDHLTGLPNRAALLDLLASLADRGRATDPTSPDGAAVADGVDGADGADDVAVLFVDLDGFKAVNDRLGHHAGDRVLATAAERLRSAVRPGDVVARHGGDEFVVVLDPAPDEDGVASMVARLGASLRAPIDVGGDVVEVGASIGWARAHADEVDVDALLRAADAAMYEAKRATR